MNHQRNLFHLLLVASVPAFLNYHIFLNLYHGVDNGRSFPPHESEGNHVHLHIPNSTTYISCDRSTSSSHDATKLDVELLFNFTLPEASLSGRQAPQRRNGTEYKSPFQRRNKGNQWWTYSDSCFALDDICRISRNRWFYYYGSSSTNAAKDANMRNTKWQPSFELKHMPYTYPKGAYADTRVQMNVDASHRISWDRLVASNQCSMSKAPHVVLQSLYNDMIGEWYSRTLMYMFSLLDIPVTLKKIQALNMTNPDIYQGYDNQLPIEETQYYIHVTIDKKALLDAHKLLLSGMHALNDTHSIRWALSAVDLLWPKNDDTCQCYEKLVFCGYDAYMQNNNGSGERYTLWPGKYIDKMGREIEGESVCNPVSPLFTMMPNECQEFAKLKSHVLSNIERNYPDFTTVIAQHRRAILHERNMIDKEYRGNTKEFRIVGLAQRSSRRVWLNLAVVMEDCNTVFRHKKIVCIEVNVEVTKTPQEQFILHRSLDVLVGIHGAQLTQAVLLRAGSHVLELLPWIPNYIQGGWTARTTRPTPLGIIFHNTDINHYGFSLNRTSVPLCKHVAPEIEKDCLTSTKNKRKFAWADRNFEVDANVVIQFVLKFVAHKNEPACSEFQSEKEFVLYNVWCKENDERPGEKQANTTMLQVKHFYHKKHAS